MLKLFVLGDDLCYAGGAAPGIMTTETVCFRYSGSVSRCLAGWALPTIRKPGNDDDDGGEASDSLFITPRVLILSQALGAARGRALMENGSAELRCLAIISWLQGIYDSYSGKVRSPRHWKGARASRSPKVESSVSRRAKNTRYDRYGGRGGRSRSLVNTSFELSKLPRSGGGNCLWI